MKQPESPDFSQPARQSPVAILLILSRFLRFLFRQFWPVLLVLFLRPGRLTLMWAVWAALVLSVLSAINSLLSYYFSRFYVAGGDLVLERGWIQRMRLSVPLERIQSISFQQSFLHRIFGAVSVEIDTAGSKGAEFSLMALDEARAHALRDYLLSRKREAGEGGGAQEEEAEPAQKVLMQLSVSDLLKTGISQNHIRTAGILTAVGLGFLDDLESALGKQLYNDMERSVGALFESLLSLTLAFVVILLLVSFIGTLVLTVVRDYDLRFIRTGQGFKVVAGLFTRREQSASLSKIQFISWSAHPIQRWLGMFSLRLHQTAGYAPNSRKTIQVPGCYPPQLEAVRGEYFPQVEEGEWEWHGPTEHFFRRRFLYMGIIPTLAGIGLSLLTRNEHMLPLFILWGPAAYFWQRRIVRTFRIGLHAEGLQLQSGFFTRETIFLLWKKVQAVSLRQSPYQRGKSLADTVLHTASGDILLPYLPSDKAGLIRDFVLYRVERG